MRAVRVRVGETVRKSRDGDDLRHGRRGEYGFVDGKCEGVFVANRAARVRLARRAAEVDRRVSRRSHPRDRFGVLRRRHARAGEDAEIVRERGVGGVLCVRAKSTGAAAIFGMLRRRGARRVRRTEVFGIARARRVVSVHGRERDGIEAKVENYCKKVSQSRV